MLTKEQLENRCNYIGGSDAPILLGLSKYRNVVDLWHEKTGQVMPRDISYLPYVKAGNFLEPSVRAWFESETGLKVSHNDEFYEHPEHAFIGGHIDGWIASENAVFEAKTASSDKEWGENLTGNIPHAYLIQLAHYMAITGADKAYIAVLIRGVDFRYYIINRHEPLIEHLVQKEVEFWDLVQNEEPPSPKTASEMITLNGYESKSESVVANDEVQKNLERLEQVNYQMSVLSNEKDELSDKIKIFMGQKDTLLSTTGRIVATWRETRPSARFDAAAFRKDSPDNYAQYIKMGAPSRRFCFIKNEELTNDN